MRRLVGVAVATAAAVALAGCGAPAGTESTTGASDRSYDVSKIEKVDAIAAKLPESVTQDGKLTVAAAIDYAPAEFRADDLQTAIGYDIDLSKALAKVLGLEYETGAADFASLLPGIGTKYDIGISSFTVTPERTASYDMISYIMVGSSFAVQKGNPKGFDPEKLCGASIAVQTGTWQEEELGDFQKECASDPINIVSYPSQSDVTTNLAGGKVDAMYADSTVADYAVSLTGEQLEVIGGVRDAAAQGIVVPKGDPELTAAYTEAMQYLMDQGIWKEILTTWGIDSSAGLDKATVNQA